MELLNTFLVQNGHAITGEVWLGILSHSVIEFAENIAKSTYNGIFKLRLATQNPRTSFF